MKKAKRTGAKSAKKAAKKSAKKPAMKSAVKAKSGAKSNAKSAAKVKPRAKVAAKKAAKKSGGNGKGLTLTELFEFKQNLEQAEASNQEQFAVSAHDLQNNKVNANIQSKKGALKPVRGPGVGNRHH